jgi:hypothetical protein
MDDSAQQLWYPTQAKIRLEWGTQRSRWLTSVHPPPPLPRWAATPNFVIPTGAKRRGGTRSFTFGYSECAMSHSPPGSVSQLTQTADPSTALRSGRDDKVEGGVFYQGPLDRTDRRKLQVPPLRCAPVEMTKRDRQPAEPLLSFFNQ